MTCDNGGAPCVVDNLWSQAIRKPHIRSTAVDGNVVIGFAGQDLHEDLRIVHVAKVGSALRGGAYYTDSQYHPRPDCIYRFDGSQWCQVRNKFHDDGDLVRDIGLCGDHAHVLLSEEFRYFGANAYSVHWQTYTRLHQALARLKQGHRVNHSADVLSELNALVGEIFAKTQEHVLGPPTSRVPSKCYVDDDGPEGECG